MPDRPPKRPDGRPDRRHANQPEAEIIVAHPAWRRAVPGVERWAARAAAAGGGAGCVRLSCDREVRALNRSHRGIDQPTNVLTFEPGPHDAGGGDIVLAYGTVLREARAANLSIARHLAHLIVHGALHLRGEDHHGAGEARAMEMHEARILRRLGIPNPWRPRHP